MRWPLPFFLMAMSCGCPSTSTHASLIRPPVPVVTVAPPVVDVPAIPEPTPTERLATFLGEFAPLDTPETLLIGVESALSSSYWGFFDSGPHTPPEDNLHTLVVHVRDGRAEFAGELPFLAVPQANGFVYMGVASYERDDTEAEKKRQGAKFGLDDEYGSKVYWYAASSLWKTSKRAQVDAERTRERKALEKQRKWGIFNGEAVTYVTSEAACTWSTHVEWTGGALAFYASDEQSLTGWSKKLPRELSKYTDDAGLLKFARDIARDREPGEENPDVSLDKPYDAGWAKADWRKESRACLVRRDGKVWLTGVIRLPNNSARSGEWEASVRDAPPELASHATPLVSLPDVARVFAVPRPLDILVSPRKTILVTQFRDRFVVYAAASATPLLSIPVSGRIVMAEWADGERANAWANVGDPPKTSATTACSCDLGQICFESQCVKPKTVFVTSTIYTGNLEGLAGGDAKCQARARAAGLDGQFKAWLSDSKTAAADRLTHANTPYVLVDGTVLAKDWSEWIGGELRAPIRLTEFGQLPTTVPHPPGCGRSLAWTNTQENGAIAKKNRSCSDWTDGTSSPNPAKGAVLGQTDSESLWSAECANDLLGCNASYPIYCVEQ